MGENPEIEPGAGVEVEQIKALQNTLREQYAEFEGGLYGQLKELGQKAATERWKDYLNRLTQHLDSVYSYITQPPEQVDITELEKISSITDRFLTNAKNYLAQSNTGEQKRESEPDNVVAEAGEDVKNTPFAGLKEKMATAEPEEPQEEPTEKTPDESKEVSAQDLQNSFQDVYSALREYDKVLLSQPPEGQAITDAEKEWIKSISEYYKTDYSLDDLEKISGNDRVMMQARARDTVNYIRDLAKMLQREPGKGGVETTEEPADTKQEPTTEGAVSVKPERVIVSDKPIKAEQIPSQEPVKIPVEQKPETSKKVEIDEENKEKNVEDDLGRIDPDRLMARAEREGWESYANKIIKLEQSTNEFIARYTLRYQRVSAESSAGILGFYEKATKKKESLFGKINERLGNLQTQAELALKKKESYQQSLASISEGLSSIDQTLDDLKGVNLSGQGRKQIEIVATNRASLVEAFEKIEGQLKGYTALVEAYKHSIKRIAYSSGIQVKNETLGISEGIKKEDLSRDTEGNITTWLHEYDDAIDGIGQHVVSETGERGYAYGSRAETARRSRRSLLEALFNYIFGISKPAAEGGKA